MSPKHFSKTLLTVDLKVVTQVCIAASWEETGRHWMKCCSVVAFPMSHSSGTELQGVVALMGPSPCPRSRQQRRLPARGALPVPGWGAQPQLLQQGCHQWVLLLATNLAAFTAWDGLMRERKCKLHVLLHYAVLSFGMSQCLQWI